MRVAGIERIHQQSLPVCGKRAHTPSHHLRGLLQHFSKLYETWRTRATMPTNTTKEQKYIIYYSRYCLNRSVMSTNKIFDFGKVKKDEMEMLASHLG